jgi:urease accessory protein
MRQTREVLQSSSDPVPPATASVTLTYDQRRKSRLRTRLHDGSELAVLLPRGTILQEGDRLRATDGTIIQVRAAAELVSTAHTPDLRLLTRAAYHLGNRHVALQVGAGWVRYRHDHVLDQLTAALGLQVEVAETPFEPEGGFAQRRQDHQHEHQHHQHEHEHEHGHRHDG